MKSRELSYDFIIFSSFPLYLERIKQFVTSQSVLGSVQKLISNLDHINLFSLYLYSIKIYPFSWKDEIVAEVQASRFMVRESSRYKTPSNLGRILVQLDDNGPLVKSLKT